jgi:regulatory protein
MESSPKKQARITSLRLLAATPKSRNELYERLLEKGYPEEIIQETLTTLEKDGLLNDRRLADDIRHRFYESKPSGTRRLDFELKRRGISEQIRQNIVDEADPEEESKRAKDIALLQWQKFERLPHDKRKKRVYDFLLRRGFSFDIARDIMNLLQREAAADES